MSIGVARYPLHGQTVKGVIRAADQALYVAKKAGRDRIEVAL
jgi:diguanylate cyclase (GGDEF)-like protein